jgi:hypothetical protein
MEFITENFTQIVVALLAISEVVSLLPGVESNGIFQLIVNVLEGLAPAKEEAE